MHWFMSIDDGRAKTALSGTGRSFWSWEFDILKIHKRYLISSVSYVIFYRYYIIKIGVFLKMNNHVWMHIDASDEFRQGDVIKKSIGSDEFLGFLITADCDIAQKKSADKFSYIEIVTAEFYIENIWLPFVIVKCIESKSIDICEKLNAIIDKIDGGETSITPYSLIAWLKERSVEEICDIIGDKKIKFDESLLTNLRSLQTLCRNDDGISNVEKYKKSMTGSSEKKIKSEFRSAFDSNKGFPDFFLIPEIPTLSGIGYVVLLRNFGSVKRENIFYSEADIHINDQPQAFYRIGRLNDTVRFAIMQKLAFLFLRIGLDEGFEKTCKTVVDLIVEEKVH